MTREYADAGESTLARSVARAPARIRKRINEVRASRGLDPFPDPLPAAMPMALAAAATAAAAGGGCGVWLDNGGDLIPVTSSTRAPRPSGNWSNPSRITTSRTASRQGGRGPLLAARVLIAPTFGRAAARNLGRQLDERVSPSAFGGAAALNSSRGWTLRGGGHDGVFLAAAPDGLRAIDTAGGLVVEWVPDLASPWAADAVRDIEDGHRGVSVLMRGTKRRTVRVPDPHELVVEATLVHIALLGRSGPQPAYGAAVAVVARNVYRDDAAALERQIAALHAACRFEARRQNCA